MSNETRGMSPAKEPAFDQASLAATAGAIGELPAVATQDWGERCAQAMSMIDPWCRVGVAIATMEPSGRLGTVEGAGVRFSAAEGERTTDARGESLTARVRIERATDLGLPLPANATLDGLAADADDMGAWRDGPLARIWNPSTTQNLLLGLVPVGTESAERCVIVFAALSHHAAAQRANARTMAALLPLLAKRAWLALPSGGSIAWLTDREQDVLDRLILGLSVRAIAEELDRSPHTVHDHVKSLHRKLNASSRGELVARALGHAGKGRQPLTPIVLERPRASTQIEPTPTSPAVAAQARRAGTF